MSTRNASRLEAGLIARKGEASPVQGSLQPAPPRLVGQLGQVSIGTDREESSGRLPRGLHGTIAVTVRLDPSRYERMKVYGARHRQTNQNILVEALDRFFAGLTE